MTPCESDRFDKQAGELVHRVDGMTYGHNDDERAAIVAAALRAEHASALERAAQWHEERAARVEREAYSCPGSFLSDADRDYIAKRAQADRGDAAEIRALIPPAAAPETQRDVPCGGCGHPLWWHQWSSKEHRFCSKPLNERDFCRCKNYQEPAAAPAAEVSDLLGRGHVENPREGEPGDAETYPEPAAPAAETVKETAPCWSRKCQLPDGHPGLHDPNPQPAPAQGAEARIAELEATLLDFLCSHGPQDCAGKGECVCDAAWPLFCLPHGRVDLARAKLAARAAPRVREGK